MEKNQNYFEFLEELNKQGLVTMSSRQNLVYKFGLTERKARTILAKWLYLRHKNE